MHCVDLGESFPTSMYLQNLASIQPRTILVKFVRSPRTDPLGTLYARDEEGAAAGGDAEDKEKLDADSSQIWNQIDQFRRASGNAGRWSRDRK